MKPGTHALELRLDGWLAVVRAFELGRAPLRELVELSPAPVPVRLETEPADGQVRVDGRPVGQSPLDLQLPPGSHWVSAEKPGFTRVEREFVAQRGGPATVTLPLQPVKPLLRLESPGSQLLVAVDQQVPSRLPLEVEVERGVHTLTFDGGVQRVMVHDSTTVLLLWTTQLETGIAPAPSTDAGLVDLSAVMVPLSMLIVSSVDLNDEAVEGRVFVDGRELGPTPFQGMIPVCATKLIIRRPDTTVEEQLQLEPMAKKQVDVRRGGRARLTSVSAFGDITFFAEPGRVAPGGALGGGGVRYDRWGTLIHGSVGLSAQALLPSILESLLSLRLPVPVLPSLDLFLGIHFRLGGEGALEVLLGASVVCGCVVESADQ